MCVKTETPERAPVKRIRTVSKQQGEKKMTKEDDQRRHRKTDH